jgi:hypothetical protein
LDAQPTFVVKGVNLDGEATTATSRAPLSQLDETVVNTVIRKINSAYGKKSFVFGIRIWNSK